ncbi:MAG TPA: extracellular solute-binding protein [Beijerinckiaceae bacterium]|jgi:iron(III) transport system substrate-binding protein
MPTFDGHKPTRRSFLTAAAALASPIGGLSARSALAQAPASAQAPARPPTKVLDFLTYADVAKAEQEGAFVFYCHENEAGTAAIAEAFGKDFPKIKTSYVRAQTGALYNKISTERAAGRFDVDILQLSDLAPALDFQKKGGYAIYHSPEAGGYRPEHLSNPAGAFFWTGVTFGGLAYSTAKVKPEEAPKSWKDLLDPKWRNAMSCKISSSGLQFVQWYELRKLYGDEYWKEFAKQRPRGFDSRVQLFDRLAKGDDKVCALAEYAAYVLYKEKGAAIEFVAPEDGLPATPLLVGIVDKAPHPEVAKLFVDWAMSNRGQAFYQSNPHLIYGSLRTDAPPMPTGKRLSDFKLLTPTDYADYLGSRDKFTKDWNGMLGL